LARGELIGRNIQARKSSVQIQLCAANTAKAATNPPARVPISNAQMNGIDLRKARRIECLRCGVILFEFDCFNDSARAKLPRR
jgi:hypothetical protein